MPSMGTIDSKSNPIVGHFSTSLMKLVSENTTKGGSVSGASAVEQSGAKKLAIPISRDTVQFSEQGKQLAATFSGPSLLSAKGISKEEEETGEKSEDSLVERAKERIQEIKQEIEEIRNSSLSDEEKQQKIAALNQEMATQAAVLAQGDSQSDVLDGVKSLAALAR